MSNTDNKAYLEGFNSMCDHYGVDSTKLAELFTKEGNLLHDAGDMAENAGDSLAQAGENVKETITDIMSAGGGILDNVKDEARDHFTGAKRVMQDAGTAVGRGFEDAKTEASRFGEDTATGFDRFKERFGSRTQALLEKLRGAFGIDDDPEVADDPNLPTDEAQ